MCFGLAFYCYFFLEREEKEKKREGEESPEGSSCQDPHSVSAGLAHGTQCAPATLREALECKLRTVPSCITTVPPPGPLVPYLCESPKLLHVNVLPASVFYMVYNSSLQGDATTYLSLSHRWAFRAFPV